MSSVVAWNELLPIANEAFRIWVGQPELRWAEQAWTHLTNAGLAADVDPLDRLRAHVRLLVLASLYRDWCDLVWDEVHDDSPQLWLSEVDVDSLRIGQLLGPDENAEDLDEGLHILMARERAAVVAAVLDGFGGVEGLFIALWRSNKDPWEDPPADDEDDWRAPAETEADILNDVTPEKMAGYQWIYVEGCESRGPIRSRAEMDDWIPPNG